MTENLCKNCYDEEAVKLTKGGFTTDLFCSWVCLGEYIDMEESN